MRDYIFDYVNKFRPHNVNIFDNTSKYIPTNCLRMFHFENYMDTSIPYLSDT